jgi:carbonic anhydrase
MKALVTDIQRIESYPLLAKNVKVMGAVFSVETGTLTPVI